MKSVSLLGLLAGLILIPITGCGTPGYTPHERGQLIARNWSHDASQIADDFDFIMLLRPASRLTIWNVQQGPGPY